MSESNINQDRIVREPECERITGLERTTRYRLEQRGEFPKRIRLSANAIGWRLSDIHEWLMSREAAS
jgi:prophage regulatory protein